MKYKYKLKTHKDKVKSDFIIWGKYCKHCEVGFFLHRLNRCDGYSFIHVCPYCKEMLYNSKKGVINYDF